MRIRLIDDDEAPAPVRIGDSTLWVRRVPAARSREFQQARRRALRRPLGADPQATAEYVQQVGEDELDYAIVRWEGIDGDPACSRENKLRLPESVKDVVRAYMASAAALGDAEGNFGGPPATPSS